MDECFTMKQVFDAITEALQQRQPELNTKRIRRKKKCLTECWTSYVGDVIDITRQIQTKAEFSRAMGER